jgi:hypothetical protein
MQPCAYLHHQTAVLLPAAAVDLAQSCWEGTAADQADLGPASIYWCCCWGWGAVAAGPGHAAAGVAAAAASAAVVTEAACIQEIVSSMSRLGDTQILNTSMCLEPCSCQSADCEIGALALPDQSRYAAEAANQ